MTIHEALDILKDNHITDSIQMLRRWIRQGKIKATMASKKQGYVIDEISLNEFIEKKQAVGSMQEVTKKAVAVVEKSNVTQKDVDTAWTEGYNMSTEINQQLLVEAVKEREKELILKGAAEGSFNYSINELLKGFPRKKEFILREHLMYSSAYTLKINHLGNWLYDKEFHILINIEELSYPNRPLKSRVKKMYRQRLLDSFESGK